MAPHREGESPIALRLLQGEIAEGPLVLRDGSTAWLRPALPSDRPHLTDLLHRLSTDSLLKRFFVPVLPETAVDSLLHDTGPDESLDLVVLLGSPTEPTIIAHGGYIREGPRSDLAEVAFLVDDAYQGKGIATLLLERLALAAARWGIRVFRAVGLPENRPMLNMIFETGFPVEVRPELGDVLVTFPIQPTSGMVARFEWRERVATVASLYPLFHPRSILAITGGDPVATMGKRVTRAITKSGFHGSLHELEWKEVPSRATAGSPGTPGGMPPADLAVVALPPDLTAIAVERCAESGVRSAIVLSQGFAESGSEGEDRERALVRHALGRGMRLLGPNSRGVFVTSPKAALNASLAPALPTRGPIAVASQSGALGLEIIAYGRQRHLGFSALVTMGNKADISSNDLLQYWEVDPETSVILFHLESFGNLQRFDRLARRVSRKKPILVVKVARTRAGRRAARANTAARPVDEADVEEVLHQTGVIRADTLEGALDVAELLTRQPLPAGPRVLVVTNAGGLGAIAADALESVGLSVPELAISVQAGWKDDLPTSVSVVNPIDLGFFTHPSEIRRAVVRALCDDQGDVVLFAYSDLGSVPVTEARAAISAAVAEARAAGSTRPIVACLPGPSKGPLPVTGESVPVFRFPESAARALGKVEAYSFWRSESNPPHAEALP